METLYQKVGARYFILQNLVPLEKAPLYADPGVPVTGNRFWAGRSEEYAGNGTRIEERMRSMVWSANEIFEYKVPALVATKLREASVAVFNAYGFVNDIMARPEKYLSGPKPLNTTGHNVQCPTATWDGCKCLPTLSSRPTLLINIRFR